MKRSVLVLFTVVLSIFFTYNVFAQDSAPAPPTPVDKDTPPRMMGRGQMRGMGPMMERGPMGVRGMMNGMFIPPEIADEIGLSEEQKSKIDDITTNHRKDMVTKKAEIEIAQIDLNKLMREENPDMNLVKDQIQKLASLKANMEFAQFKTRIDAKKVLTQEQQDKIKELMKERRDQMNERAKGRSDAGQRPQRQGMGNRPKMQ